MTGSHTPYSPGEAVLRDVLVGLTALSGPGRRWLPVSTVARSARRSVTATYRALEKAEARRLVESRLSGHGSRPQREYRPTGFTSS